MERSWNTRSLSHFFSPKIWIISFEFLHGPVSKRQSNAYQKLNLGWQTLDCSVTSWQMKFERLNVYLECFELSKLLSISIVFDIEDTRIVFQTKNTRRNTSVGTYRDIQVGEIGTHTFPSAFRFLHEMSIPKQETLEVRNSGC